MDDFPTDHPFLDGDDDAREEPDEVVAGRRWPIVLSAMVLAIVVIGVTLFEAASHYQPLSQSLSGSYGSQVLTANGSLATDLAAGGAGGTLIWNEPTGTYTVEVIVSINNLQRFGVTIDKVLAPAGAVGLSNYHVFLDSTSLSPGAYGYKGGPAFTSAVIASKGQLQVVVHWTQQCETNAATNGSMSYSTLPVEYTFQGFRHTVSVPIKGFRIRTVAAC